MKDAISIGSCTGCPRCDSPLYRRQADAVHTDLQEFHTPIELYSVACNSMDEIRQIQKDCPDADISDDPNNPLFGVPVARTRKAKLQVLAATKFSEIT